MPNRLFIILLGIILSFHVHAQTDSESDRSPVSIKYLAQVSARSGKLEQKLDKQSERILAKFLKAEQKLQRKLAKKDSSKAKEVFGNAQEQYIQLQDKLAKTDKLKQYIPSLDTLSTSLKFLGDNPTLLAVTEKSSIVLQNCGTGGRRVG